MDQEEKVRENRIRRKLARMGYGLTKSRVRDHQAYNYNGYMIVDAWPTASSRERIPISTQCLLRT